MNEFTPIPLGGELVVSGDTVIDTEVVEGTVEETVVDNTENDTELVTDTAAEDNTTADPLDEDISKKFVLNNWLKEHNTSELLYRLWLKGAAVYMQNGLYWYRQSINSNFSSMPKNQVQDAIANILGQQVNIGQTDDHKIKVFDLLNVEKEQFNPAVKREFYSENGVMFRNTFRSTPYMEMDKETAYQKPLVILALLLHLTKTNDRLTYFINWLAYFFQGLKKSPVAIVLKGRQGAGKGILWDYILKALFGAKQCFQLNDKTIRGNFLADALDGKLMLGCDEISHGGTDNKLLKNFLKGVISNPTGAHEKKHKSLSAEINLYAAVLITTNEVQSLEIEFSDRRYTILTTGDNLAKVDFLGYGTFNSLLSAIQGELEDFALYLLNYEVDVNLACTAQDTPEKRALAGVTNDRFLNFAHAIMKKNLKYFTDLTYEAPALYGDLKAAFTSNRISRKMLKECFCAIEEEKISAKKLMSRLRVIDEYFFGDENTKGRSNGDVVFCLDESIILDEASAPATPVYTPCNLPGFPQGIVINPSL